MISLKKKLVFENVPRRKCHHVLWEATKGLMDQGLPPQELEPVKASDAKLSVEELGAIESKNSVIILEATRRKIRSQQIVVSNIFWAVSLGAIPVPMVDIAATSAIQMKMISELSLQYDVRFSKNRVRAILASLGGGASIIGLSWLKIVPGHVQENKGHYRYGSLIVPH